MSQKSPSLLVRYNNAFKVNPGRGSSFTLSKFANRLEGCDQKLQNLLGAVSQQVYAKFARSVAAGGGKSFAHFLVDCCCNMDDVLSTPQYKAAKDEAGRKQAVLDWLEQVREYDSHPALGGAVSSATAATQAPRNQGEECQLGSLIDDIYSKFSQPAAAKPALVSHNTRLESAPPKNIVVQPPHKPKGEAKKTQVAPLASTSLASVYVDLARNGEYAKIPRRDLEALAKYMERLVENGDSELIPVLSGLTDVIHSGFDCSDYEHIKNAISIVKDHGIENLPRRERRALVDLLNRGAPKLWDSLEKDDADGVKALRDCKKELQALADKDLLAFAPEIVDIISNHCPSGEKRTFVVSHNEVPVLRHLAIKESPEKMAKYMQNLQLKDKGAWSSSLCESQPFVSQDGKITVYASAPYKDSVNVFRKLVGACGDECEKNAVWLAPTDEALVSKGIYEKVTTWSHEQLTDFIRSHMVKPVPGLENTIKKMAAGQQEWSTSYEMANGKEGKTMIKTRVVADRGNIFVPIGHVLC